MDWKTFATTLIDSLAWPISVIAVVALLRNQIVAALRNIVLRRLRGSGFGIDFEADFDERAEIIGRRIQDLIPAPEISDEPVILDDIEGLPQLVDISPPAAIIEAWILVESELIRIARSRGVIERVHVSIGRLPRILSESGLIEQEVAALVDDLRGLRNTAAHRAERTSISRNSALEYIRSVELVVRALRQIKG